MPINLLFAEADVISLHIPGGAERPALIDARRLASLKPTAILVNTARGEIILEAVIAGTPHPILSRAARELDRDVEF